MKVKITTGNKYLFDKIHSINIFDTIKLDKDKTNLISLNRIIKSINRKSDTIRITETQDQFIIKKINSKLNLMLYYR